MPHPTPAGGSPAGIERLPLRLTITFGLMVIVAFGSWFYGFGVLIEPIGADTGWAESTLSTAYGAGLFAVGLGAVLAGRVIDRFGPRPVFASCAVGAFTGTLATVQAGSPALFTVAAVGTQCFIGVAGYYTAVHAAIARLVPTDRTRAITVNTLWGAFASPVFLPL
ncbi:MAG TPA: MFS transporter, partial [Beutenbergiaceae bacterium]|nr:MFS transporter [Beutenbergiaceae bacterium]